MEILLGKNADKGDPVKAFNKFGGIFLDPDAKCSYHGEAYNLKQQE